MSDPTKHIQILLIGGPENGMLPAIEQLKRNGFAPQWRRADSGPALVQALKDRAWDLVLCGDRTPGLSGMDALKIVRESSRELPFIILSDAIGEDAAVALIKAGADDCFRTDALGRLAPAVARELRDAEVRRENRRRETTLLKGEENLRMVETIAMLGNWEWDILNNEVTWSDGMYRICGMDPATDRPSYDLVMRTIAPEDRDRFANELDAALKHGRPFEGEFRMIAKDGSERYLHAVGEVVRDGQGRPVSMFGVVRDITRRRKVEESLHKAETLYHELVETAQDLIWQCDARGHYTYLNGAWEGVLGYRIEEMLGKRFTDFQGDAVARQDLQLFERLLQTGMVKGYETVYRSRDGRDVNLLFNAKVVLDGQGNVIGTRGTAYDITERKRMEAQLREREEQYRLLVETANSVILTWDTTGKILFVNEYCERFLGFGKEELIGSNIVGTIVPEIESSGRDLARLMQEIQRDPDRFRDTENENITRDGRRVWVRWANKAITDKTGKAVGILSVGTDITERRHAEERLRETNQTLNALVRHSPLAIICTGLDGRVLIWNAAAERIFGWSEQETIGRMNPMVPEGKREEYRNLFAQVRDGHPYQAKELLRQRKDGTLVHLSASSSALSDAEGTVTAVLGIFEDITERKRTEKELAERGALVQQIMDTANVGIALVDRTGRFTLANKRMADLFGGTMADLIGSAYLDHVHPSEGEIGRKSLLSLLAGEVSSVELDRRYVRRDGAAFWGHLTCNRFYDAGGNMLGLIGVITDISERKQAEAELWNSRSMLGQILDTLPQSVFWKDQQSVYLGCNEVFARAVGLDRAEVIKGKTDFDLPWPRPEAEAYRADDHEVMTRNVSKRHIIEPLQQADGTRLWIDTSKVPLVDRDGGVFGVLGVYEDITDRKNAEEKLQYSERQLAESQRIAHIGSWEHNLTTGRVFWSDELFRLLGLDPQRDRADFTMFFEMVHPDDQLPLKRAVEETVQGRKPFDMEYRFVYRDGAIRTIQVRAELVHDATGTQNILRGTAQDITERKRQEQAMAESEANYRNLFDSSTDGIFILDLDGNFIDANRTAYERLGYTRDEFLALSIAGLDHPDFVSQVPERLRTIRENGMAVFESGHLRKDGSLMPVEVNSRLLEHRGRTVLFSVVRDITDRKRTEERLRLSEQRLRTLLDAIPDAVFFKDAAGRHIIANKANEDIYGLPPQAMVGKTVEDLLPPEAAAVCRRNDDEVMKQRAIVRSEEQSTDKSGTVHILDTTKVPLYDGEGSAAGLVGIARDITDQKRAEATVRRSEQFVRNILDTVDEGFIVVDRDYRIVTANKAYCGQAGMPCDEVIGRHCYEISHHASRPCYEEGEECAVRQVFATGEQHAVSHKHLDRDGQVMYVETKAFPIKDDQGRVIQAIETISNITEKHLLEEERLKTQKLESIGTLAGGIAHDFNNLLQGIFGYIAMAKLSMAQKERAIEMLDQAERAVHQSVSLTSQLLTFSKGGKPVKQRVDLRPVIENATRFALSGSRSNYRLEIAPDLWDVDADSGQVGQVIQNIVLNADQAMPQQGTVTVAARNVRAADPAYPHGLAPADYVMIEVQDSGVGIPEQIIEKIFDPYFTTKQKGSGLGLATSYSIIKNHDGRIDVRSAVGEGSVFTVYLPAARTAPAVVQDRVAAPARRRGRVLVMDDEEVIRNVARDQIVFLGHEVAVAEHGEAALRVYQDARAEGRPFDVVILDLTIRGGMGGLETLKRLVEFDPGVKAVVSSGYSEDSVVSRYLESGFRAFLKKPYDIPALQSILNDLMT